MTTVVYKSDTVQRRQWFTGLSFSHPAKMILSLQIFLIDNFTKPGDVILDPLAGSGTVLVACSMGRDVITVELEDKFVKMQQGNWQQIQQRGPQMGYTMGSATILKGDARQLPDLLADCVISSPPYAKSVTGEPGIDFTKVDGGKRDMTKEAAHRTRLASLSGYSPDPTNIGNLKYGEISTVIGNLRKDSYLEAMLAVYKSCYQVLKSGGTMALVTKNYIRNKQIVRLDLDTIKLCEKAGFIFTERIERKLTQQSFWRIIYKQKYPLAPSIDTEDILVFRKAN